MTVLGITGGVGSGKSRVLEILRADHHALIIQADEVAKELEEPGRPGLAGLVEKFGTGILDEEGRLDRERFARLIFQDEKALEAVNGIIHPLTWQTIKERIAASDSGLAAVEAALLDESSRDTCQYLVFVDTGEETRIRRLMENRGYSREKCMDIIKNQPEREEFLRLADFVIDNNGSLEEVRRQIEKMLEEITDEIS